MKINTYQWIEDMISLPRKKPFPVLSFPAIQIMGITVKELISSSDAQARGMIEIAKRVETAASVSLMDLSVEAECFGSEISVSDGEVPTVVGSIISNAEQAGLLSVPPIGSGRTSIYIDAIAKAAAGIPDRPVFAGTIGPFSLAGRLMDVTDIMIYCYDNPGLVHTVLRKATDFLINYMRAYKEAGANGIVMAEPLAGLLSPDLASEFSCRYLEEIVNAVQGEDFLIVYHNCGGNTVRIIDLILGAGVKAMHFGDAIDMAEMMPHIPKDHIAMGNVSPAGQFRNGTPETVRSDTLELMEKCSSYDNFIPSSGCDIPPLTPWENIYAFFDAVEEFYEKGN